MVLAMEQVKKHGLKLYLSYIIGLPGDSIRATLDSIRFARRVDCDIAYWNVMVPYKGTKAYNWFEHSGRLGDKKIPHTLLHSYEAVLPSADTKEFPAWERLRALFIAEVMTGAVSMRGRKIPLMIYFAIRYGFIVDFLGMLFEKVARRFQISWWWPPVSEENLMEAA